MPWEVEASTAKSVSRGLGGLWRIEEQLVFMRVFSHHPVSMRMGIGTEKHKKDDLVAENSEVKQERDGRQERLSGRARLRCTKVLRRLLASLRVALKPGTHGFNFRRNLSHFSGGIWTEWCSRSHKK